MANVARLSLEILANEFPDSSNPRQITSCVESTPTVPTAITAYVITFSKKFEEEYDQWRVDVEKFLENFFEVDSRRHQVEFAWQTLSLLVTVF